MGSLQREPGRIVVGHRKGRDPESLYRMAPFTRRRRELSCMGVGMTPLTTCGSLGFGLTLRMTFLTGESLMGADQRKPRESVVKGTNQTTPSLNRMTIRTGCL